MDDHSCGDHSLDDDVPGDPFAGDQFSTSNSAIPPQRPAADLDRPGELLREQFDACRPDYQDERLSGMAELARQLDTDADLRAALERSRQFDRSLRVALCDVHVPAGLHERILAQLKQAEAADSHPAREHEPTSPAMPRLAGLARRRDQGAPPWRRLLSRRRVLWALPAAAVLLIGLGIQFWPHPSHETMGADDIMQLAAEWLGQETVGKAWSIDPSAGKAFKEPPTAFAQGDVVRVNERTQWRWIDGRFLGRKGVAFELDDLNGTTATLLVLAQDGSRSAPSVANLPSNPTSHLVSTGGRTTAIWTDRARIFVLVIHGNEDALRGFLKQRRSIT